MSSKADAESQRSILRLSVAKVLAFAQRQAQDQADPSLEYDPGLWQSAMLHLPLFGPAGSSEETTEVLAPRGDVSAWEKVLAKILIGTEVVVKKVALSDFVQKQAASCATQTTNFEITTVKMVSRALSATELVGSIQCISTQFTVADTLNPLRSGSIPVLTKSLEFVLKKPLQPDSARVLSGIDEKTITLSDDYIEIDLD